MRETALNTKTIKLLTEEQTVCLLTINPCYLLMLLLKEGPVVGIHAIGVANLMSEATAPHMGKCVINIRVLIISKPFVIPRLQQPRQCPALTGRSSLSCRPGGHPQAATVAMAEEEAGSSRRRRRRPRSCQSRKHMRLHLRTQRVTPGRENGKVLQNSVLSGLEEEGTYNRFSCYAVNSKMAQSTNTKSKSSEGLYTDIDPDNRSEIITDITIRVPGKAGTMIMEVKVDPGAQPSCIPLHKFKILFSHLCRDGLPKKGLLDNTHNEFESYNGGDLTCYGIS